MFHLVFIQLFHKENPKYSTLFPRIIVAFSMFRRSQGERLLLHTVYDQIQEEPGRKAIVAYSI